MRCWQRRCWGCQAQKAPPGPLKTAPVSPEHLLGHQGGQILGKSGSLPVRPMLLPCHECTKAPWVPGAAGRAVFSATCSGGQSRQPGPSPASPFHKNIFYSLFSRISLRFSEGRGRTPPFCHQPPNPLSQGSREQRPSSPALLPHPSCKNPEPLANEPRNLSQGDTPRKRPDFRLH